MTLARRPHGSGDAWVTGPDGRTFWGTFGAAGLLVLSRRRGVLLQHRAEWSHFGGTWALPGGARHEGESAYDGAVREAAEEAGVPADGVRRRFLSRHDLGWWSYSTVAVEATRDFEPEIGDAESLELRWVPLAEVDALPLHPTFAQGWPSLRTSLAIHPHVVVDAANVVGARPDGWWRDRPAAAARLAGALTALQDAGWPARLLGLPHDSWWPRVSVVLEGAATRMPDPDDGAGIEFVRADGDGDGAIVDRVAALPAGERAVVVTSDRGLRERVTTLGAGIASPGALWAAVDALE
jgi:8-oxo-dGTP diphosphatase